MFGILVQFLLTDALGMDLMSIFFFRTMQENLAEMHI
jgi:hypothetical protein